MSTPVCWHTKDSTREQGNVKVKETFGACEVPGDLDCVCDSMGEW